MGRVVRLEAALREAASWYSAATRAELAEAVTASVARLIPCDRAVWNEVDPVARRVMLVGQPDAPTALQRHLDQHPIARHMAATGSGAAIRFSDLITRRAYRGLDLYRDYYRDEGVEFVLAAAARVTPVEVGVSLRRQHRDFSEDERALLDVLRPQLAAAHAAVARAEALEHALDADGRGVVLTEGGRIVYASPLGRRLLTEWFGGELPADTDGARLRRHGLRLDVQRTAGRILLSEHRETPDPQRVRALGLSAREAEVAALAGQGLTDAQIAAQLYLSPRTVQKHLQHVFDKLGVRTRSAAARQLLGQG